MAMMLGSNYIGAKSECGKRGRLEWIPRFPSCVFTSKSGKDQREFRFCFRILSNIIPAL